MTMEEQFASFRNAPPPGPSYASGPSRGGEMTRLGSQGAFAIDPSLKPVEMSDPTYLTNHQPQRRSISGPVNARSGRQPSASTFLAAGGLAPVNTAMQRARSQADQFAYQDQPQVPITYSNQRVNYHFTPSTGYDPNFGAMQASYTYTHDSDDQQPRKFKKARTVAGNDLRSTRTGDFTSPQEIQVIPSDLRNHQEDLVGFGSNPAAEIAPIPSPHQGFEVNVIQPPESPSKSKLQEGIEDVINSFLGQLKSKAGNQSMSDDDFLNQIKLSLGSSDTMTSCGTSSIGPASARADSRSTGGIHCPKTNQVYFACPICQKIKKRQSDLNKHMQRHSKPYGCVFDKCQKTFGSKNDWKRHEQTQHEQQECWRCQLCFEVFFYDQSHYTEHMRLAHSTKRPEESAQTFRVARNYQGRFWCGFCRKIMTHTKTDVEAITLRFDHIAEHFTKEGKASKDWVELTGKGRTKKEIQDEQSKTTAEADGAASNSQATSGSTHSPSSRTSDSSPIQRSLSQHSAYSDSGHIAMADMQIPQDLTSTMTMQNPAIVQRQAQQTGSQGRHQSQQFVRAKFISCCQCSDYTRITLSSVCTECNHLFCTTCPVREEQLVRET